MRLGGGKIYLGNFARPRLIHKLSTFHLLCDDRSILNNHTHLAVGVVVVGGEWVGGYAPRPSPCLPSSCRRSQASFTASSRSCLRRAISSRIGDHVAWIARQAALPHAVQFLRKYALSR
jgi:hypothetical protein